MQRTSFVGQIALAIIFVVFLSHVGLTQPRPDRPPREREDWRGERPREFGARPAPPPGFGPPDRGFGGPGPGGMGGPNRKKSPLVAQFDENDDGWLNQSERVAARREAKALASERPGRRGRGPRGGRGNLEPPKPGKQISPDQVKKYPDADLYDPTVLRTLFFEFENDDWETELSDFKNTDVEVPATMIVDGKTYPNVGVRFRGASSYFMVPAGRKRSFNVSIDLADSKQRLGGYRTLNLLNSNGDSSMMSSVLYSEIAQKYIPVPKANHVRVVINGESWGIYVNSQQFNKDFLKEHFDSKKGTRWKVPGSPRGDGGLRYLGEEIAPYKERFTIKPSDNDHAWEDLIALCRTLDETPPGELVSALKPMLDTESTLWFLALDVSLVNSDGYWVRASDYSLYQDEEGKFHIIPHDMNEAFTAGLRHGRPGGGRGRDGRRGQRDRDRRPPPGGGPFGPPPGPAGGFGGGPPRGGGGERPSVTLDPLVGIDNDRMPLRSRLLAVPELRRRYLQIVRELAEYSLDWQTMGPRVAAYRSLIGKDVEADTRKLSTYRDFLTVTESKSSKVKSRGVANTPESLQDFFQMRQNYLLKQTDMVQN